MIRKAGAAVLAVVAGACGPAAPADRMLPGQTGPLFTLGADDIPATGQFGTIAAVAFDGADRLYVLDGLNRRITVWDSAGALVRAFGRPGSGPGELSTPSGIAVLGDGRVVVSDLRAGRYVVYDSAGRPAADLAFDLRHGVPGLRLAADSADAVVTAALPIPTLPGAAKAAQEGSTWLVRQHLRPGVPSQGLFRVPGEPQPAGKPRRNPPAFHPTLRWAVLPQGRFAVVADERYAIRIVSAEGDSVGTVQRAFAPRRVTGADRDRARDELRRSWSDPGLRVGGSAGRPPPEFVDAQVRALRFEKRVPAVAALAADRSGRLWVERESPDAKHLIDVFSAAGAYVGTMAGEQMPDAFGPGGRAAYVERPEGGAPRVHVRRVQPAPIPRLGRP